jgi:hypothetical protein
MTWRKRLRILVAVFGQEWHEKKCAECLATWMAVGPDRPELIAVCDNCEVENLNRFMEFSEQQYQVQMQRSAQRES